VNETPHMDDIIYPMDENNKFGMDENFHMEQYDSSE
jgi:hypothetical protein